MQRMLSTTLALICLMPLALSAPALSQSWPTKPVKVVVGFPAGTSSDIIARIYAERLADHFKQPFVVENIVGAASGKAAGMVAAAEGDGHTLFLGTAANSISQSVFKKQKFDFGADFTPIATLGLTPTALVVGPSLGVNSVAELIAHAKSNPEKVFYASAGVGTTPHLAAEMFNQLAGIKLIHVPYKGTNEALSDLLGGRISVTFAPVTTLIELIKGGQVKGLAVGSLKRSPLLPELPSLAESGVAGFDAVIWYGFLGPKGVPAPVVETIADVVSRAMARDDMKAKLTANGADPWSLKPAEFSTFVRDDIAKWKKIVEAAGVSIE